MAAATPPLAVPEREVSASEAEFLRCLRVAHAGPVVVSQEGGVTVARLGDGGVALEIELTPLPPRRIALLHLPSLRARYRFVSGEAAACADLLRRLDLGMQRGGG